MAPAGTFNHFTALYELGTLYYLQCNHMVMEVGCFCIGEKLWVVGVGSFRRGSRWLVLCMQAKSNSGLMAEMGILGE